MSIGTLDAAPTAVSRAGDPEVGASGAGPVGRPRSGGETWRSRFAAIGWVLVLPAVVLPLWAWTAAAGILPEQILPAPGYVWQAFADMVVSGELWFHTRVSLVRVVEGFGLGTVLGLAVGAAMGLSKRVDETLHPSFIALAQVPTLAWIPFLMLLVGIGETLKILVITKAAFVPVTINTRAGILAVPRQLTEVGDVFGFTALQRLRLIELPGTVPTMFTGIRYGLTHAWIALVSVELLASSEGLGYLLVWGRQMFWLDTVMVAMIVIGVVGWVTDRLLGTVETRLQLWRPGP